MNILWNERCVERFPCGALFDWFLLISLVLWKIRSKVSKLSKTVKNSLLFRLLVKLRITMAKTAVNCRRPDTLRCTSKKKIVWQKLAMERPLYCQPEPLSICQPQSSSQNRMSQASKLWTIQKTKILLPYRELTSLQIPSGMEVDRSSPHFQEQVGWGPW